MKIQEIAALAGVSTATVSRVFSHHPNIREEVREKLRAEIREKDREEGRAEGRAENQKAIALQLLKMGRFPLEDIAEITSLSLDDVRAIAARDGR